jgi:hypothetical protein
VWWWRSAKGEGKICPSHATSSAHLLCQKSSEAAKQLKMDTFFKPTFLIPSKEKIKVGL